MLPLVLDVATLRILLVGNGRQAQRRLALLDEAGAGDVVVHADRPTPELARAAGSRLIHRLPTAPEMAGARLIFIADAAPADRRDLAATARAAGVFVHVEDAPAISDLQAPATLRRGDLVIAVSTGGRSPGLAVRVKRFLEGFFGPEWQGRLDDIASLRRGWREAGADLEQISRWTEEWVGRQGWLPAESSKTAYPSRH